MSIKDKIILPETKEDLASSMEVIRVLHVDDDDDIQTFLKIFIEADPHIKITSITKPEETIPLVLTEAYDCLITDYDMPSMDGLTLAKKVREVSNIPIIIYTGRGSEEIAENAFAAGVDDYIRKETTPAHYQVVSKRIKQAVERRRSNESYRSLFDSANDAIHIHTLDGLILDANEAACIRLECAKSELIGSSLFQYIPLEPDSVKDILERIRLGGRSVFEAKERSRSGTIIPVEVSAKAIRYMGFEAVLSFSRDISERKRLESQMKERLEALQSHMSKLRKCETVNEVAETTYQILHEVMDYSFFGLGLIEEGKIRFVSDTFDDTDWVYEYSLRAPGICSRAVETASTVIIDDVRLDPDYIGPKSGYKYLSEIVVPVEVDGKIVAVINVEDEEKNRFTREDKTILEIFSQHIGSSIYRINLLRSTRKSLERLEEINSHALLLSNFDTVDEVADYTFKIVKKILGFEQGYIGIVEDEYLKFRYSTEPYIVPDLKLDGKGITTRTYRTGTTQLVRDTRLDPDFVKDIESIEFLSELDVPIKVDGRVFAIINLQDERLNYFSDEDREVVEILARHLGSVIENIKRKEKLASLHKYTARLVMSTDVGEIARLTVETLRAVFDFKISSFHVLEGDSIKIASWLGYLVLDDDFVQRTDSPGVIPIAFRERRSVYVPDSSYEANYVRGHISDELILHSEFVSPIIVDGVVVAAINVEDSKVDTFTIEDRELIETLSKNVALAFSRVQKLKTIMKNEEDLKKSEERYMALVENSPNAISITVRGKIVYANRARAKLAGIDDPSKLIGTTSLLQIAPDRKDSVRDRIKLRNRGEKLSSPYSFKLITSTGKVLDMLDYCSDIIYGGEQAVQHMLLDITGHKLWARANGFSEFQNVLAREE